MRTSGLGGRWLSRSVVVQVAPKGCRVISYDASGSQAVGRFKIRLFIKAPKYHLVGREGLGVFQQLYLAPGLISIGWELSSSVEASQQWGDGAGRDMSRTLQIGYQTQP